MDAKVDSRLEDLLARQEIYALICAYARAQDRLDTALQLSVFWPDAWTDYGYFAGYAEDFVAYAQGALRAQESSHHLIGQVDIDIQGDVAFGEVYTLAQMRTFGDAASAKEHFVGGRYIDRYERRGGVWKIAFRSELVDWVRTEPVAESLLGGAWTPRRGGRGPLDMSFDRDAWPRPPQR